MLRRYIAKVNMVEKSPLQHIDNGTMAITIYLCRGSPLPARTFLASGQPLHARKPMMDILSPPGVEGVRFREITGHPGYFVGENGAVWRFHKDRWKFLRGITSQPFPYRAISFWDKTTRTHSFRHVHRLVLEAFIGPCPEGMECCHNNGDPTDNRLENLRWDTPLANNLDKILHGTMPRGDKHWSRRPAAARRFAGLKNPYAKVTIEMSRYIQTLLASGLTLHKIASLTGISQATVHAIKHRTHWTTKEI